MSEQQPPETPVGGSSPGHEQSDLNPRTIAISLCVLAAMVGGVLAISKWFHDYSAARHARMEALPVPPAKPAQPPSPRLQVLAPKEMQEFRAAEDAILTRYGWLDRANGVVRIPIDPAMQLLVERGLPASGPRGKSAKAR